jgi:topoisomerase-4 subunit A
MDVRWSSISRKSAYSARGRGLKLIDATPGKTGLEDIVPVIDGAAGKLKGERLEVCRGSRGGKGKLVRASRK